MSLISDNLNSGNIPNIGEGSREVTGSFGSFMNNLGGTALSLGETYFGLKEMSKRSGVTEQKPTTPLVGVTNTPTDETAKAGLLNMKNENLLLAGGAVIALGLLGYLVFKKRG